MATKQTPAQKVLKASMIDVILERQAKALKFNLKQKLPVKVKPKPVKLPTAVELTPAQKLIKDSLDKGKWGCQTDSVYALVSSLTGVTMKPKADEIVDEVVLNTFPRIIFQENHEAGLLVTDESGDHDDLGYIISADSDIIDMISSETIEIGDSALDKSYRIDNDKTGCSCRLMSLEESRNYLNKKSISNIAHIIYCIDAN